MDCAVGLPNLRELADPRVLAELGRRAEAAGWDGAFVWDHIAARDPAAPATDPWIALAAIAAATERVRLGALVTPLARRRPWKVARETVALDQLSDGRLIFGVGLGAAAEQEFAAFGEEGDPRVRARKLDEGLEVLTRLWSGSPVDFDGEHLRVHGAEFHPTPVQRPRIPVWVAGRWPNKPPFRRAARWDGVFPIRDGLAPTETTAPADVAAAVAYATEHRDPELPPLDVVVEGLTPGRDRAADAATVGRYGAEAGVTWWIEKLGWFRGGLEAAQARIDAGPPR
jgi:alkanesulfonate monooxygenase SsuD/methylene tetrahydromethanopterin reductase-like flavin-dependent oxidoreductase (luciferase family)